MGREYNLENCKMKNFAIEDSIIQYKILLSRNIKGYKFPNQMSSEKAEEVSNKIIHVLNKIGTSKRIRPLRNMEDSEILSLYERSKISKNFLLKLSSGVLIENDESSVIMINEEDHVKIQALCRESDIGKIRREIKYLDAKLAVALGYSFDEKFGYLTSSIENLGTGLKIYAYLSLPALEMNKKLEEISAEVREKGVDFQALYPDVRCGQIFVISNTSTMGITEEEILDLIEETSKFIAEKEYNEYQKLIIENEIEVMDKIYRAESILKNSRIISFQEATEMISYVRLGVIHGIIKGVDIDTIDELRKDIGQGSLQFKFGVERKLNFREVEIYRSQYIRKILRGGDIDA